MTIFNRSMWSKVVIAVCLLSLVIAPTINALGGKFDEGFYSSNDILFYNPEATSCVAGAAGTGSSTGSDKATSGAWSSGLSAPFILEQFAIETLKNVATKKGVDPTNAVTQEHVIALVAFMLGEGGDIMNQDLFNPLNSGINDPTLIDGAARSDGVQSFKSFDAGVEATARTIVGSYQSRLGNILTQKDSTAQQFMSALTYYNKYPGNHSWARLSEENPSGYYQGRLVLVQQVRSNYADSAGLIIGTPQKEQLLNLTSKAKLTFHPTTDTSSSADSATNTGGSSGCPADSGVMSGSIIETALKLAWPTKHDPPLTPTPAYVEAMNKYNPGALSRDGGADCGAFVGTVMRTSGVDKNYPEASTSAQLEYAKQHPEKYAVLAAITSTADMQPGDILVTSNHTFIFVGKQSNGNDQASASQGDRMPNLGKATTTDTTGKAYSRIRVIK